jgi:hypothetical protein
MATANDTGTLALETVTPLHWAGVVLAAITGVLHLVLTVQLGLGSLVGLGGSFLVAGVGFFAGAGAVVADYRRRQFYLLGIPFTAGQIVLWYVLNDPSFSGVTLGIVDKVVQVALIGVLAVLYSREG